MKKIFKTMLICCIILSQAQFLQAQSGESLNFANGDYVDFGNTLGNFGTGNFTFETWFKTTATNQTIISKRPACSAGNFWNVRINATGKVYFEM
ncbi:MAG: hypothetical protein IPN26_02130 [Bacteroidetes bacterium]|nr:hypothetical protein [Bacteroidota bacterium]